MFCSVLSTTEEPGSPAWACQANRGRCASCGGRKAGAPAHSGGIVVLGLSSNCVFQLKLLGFELKAGALELKVAAVACISAGGGAFQQEWQVVMWCPQ